MNCVVPFSIVFEVFSVSRVVFRHFLKGLVWLGKVLEVGIRGDSSGGVFFRPFLKVSGCLLFFGDPCGRGRFICVDDVFGIIGRWVFSSILWGSVWLWKVHLHR